MELLFVFGIGVLRIFQSSLNKQSSKHLESINTYLRFGVYFESVAALFALFYLCILGFNGFNSFTVVCSLLMGTAFLIELTTSLKALQNAPLPLCTMCSLGGGIILPAISGIFFFNEPMNVFGWLGVALFFISAYFLMPYEKKTVHIKKSTVVFLLCNFVINGCCGIISKFFAVGKEDGNAAMFACLSYVFAAILFGAVVFFTKVRRDTSAQAQKLQAGSRQAFLPKPVYISGGAVGVICASIVFFTTVLSRTVSIIVLNTLPNAVCLIGSLAVEALWFGNKLTLRQIIGVVLNILATVIIVLL